MNELLKDSAKAILLDLLNQCTDGQQFVFKRMYSHGNLELPINKVVDNMPDEKLDWAISQCQRTINKNLIEKGKDNE
jgi:hypothetical protein